MQAHTGYAALVGNVYVFNNALGHDSVVRVHGEGFAFPSPLNVDWKWLSIPVRSESILRVDTRANTRHSNLRMVLMKSANETIEPIEELSVNKRITQVYHLLPSRTMYFLGIGALTAGDDRVQCPQYGMDLALGAESALYYHMMTQEVCPRSLPETNLTVPDSGVAVQELVGSWPASDAMDVPIHFTLHRDSYISAQLDHPYVASLFTLTLHKQSTHGQGVSFVFMRSVESSRIADEHRLKRSRKSKLDDVVFDDQSAVNKTLKSLPVGVPSNHSIVDENDFRVSMRGYLEKGTYTLRVQERMGPVYRELFRKLKGTGGDTTLPPPCVEFKWKLVIEPDSKRRAELDKPNASTSSSGGGDDSNDDAQNERFESVSTSAADVTGHGRHSSSKCVFGHEVVGECVCNTGYAGATCEECGRNYVKQADGKCKKRSVPIPRNTRKRPTTDGSGNGDDSSSTSSYSSSSSKRTRIPTTTTTTTRGTNVKNQCPPTMCGCKNAGADVDNGVEQCAAIGRCFVSGRGSRREWSCECPAQYTGEHCERCATGYSGWPMCSEIHKTCDSDCGPHGHCDDTVGECACDAGWGGRVCSIDLGTGTMSNHHIVLHNGGGSTTSMYVVYSATVLACSLVVVGLVLHYKQKRRLRNGLLNVAPGRGSSYRQFYDDGL
eukprot:TRINITY_DN67133_c7_g2_i1.p1 TRINITY_DN67133_c7_g2~~TRINITY_DN67133_c7_g2_i1.p1  ORF type:complete len:738 (+),score=365.71 TRINITY_DN67133_c7_g2_i1:228-2216(+)